MYDYNKGHVTTLVTGLRCVGGGDAETLLNTLKEILDDLSLTNVSNNDINDTNFNNDINNSHADKDANSNFVSSLFFSKNKINVRQMLCTKKFNYLFYQYRKSVIPETVDTPEDLDAKQKKCIMGVNDFYCSFHFLVGLADQAEVSL